MIVKGPHSGRVFAGLPQRVEAPPPCPAVDAPFRKPAFYCALALLFVRCSGIHELIAYTLNFNPYLVAALTPLTLVFVVLSGGLRRTLSARPARYWLGILAWLTAATLFSTWKFGSLVLLFNYVRVEYCLLFVVGGTVATWAECVLLFHSMALATIVTLVLGLFYTESAARLALEFGIMANANDFAAHLMFLLPFVGFSLLAASRSALRRLLAFVMLPAGLALIVATDSRGALVALLAALAFGFLRAPAVGRLALAAAAPVVLLLSLYGLPADTLQRWSTLLRDAPDGEMNEAIASREARSRLLRTSIRMTLRNPVFGVGPGQFATAEAAEAKRAGLRGRWQVTHNSYTQLSSEAGLVPLIMLIAALVSTFRLLSTVHREARSVPGGAPIAAAAFSIALSMVGFCTCAMFLSLFYRFYLPLFTGLAIALAGAWRRERERLETAPPVCPP